MQAIREFMVRAGVFVTSASPRWRMLVTLSGLVLFAIGLNGIIQLTLAHPAYPDTGATDRFISTDLDLYVRAADNLSNHPYRADLGTGLDRYGYPPLLAGIIAALKWLLGPQAFGLFWHAACAGALIGAIVMMARAFGAKLGWHWIVFAIGLVFLGRVVRIDIYHGQVNVFVLLLFVTGLLLHSQGRIIAAAMAFAVMMSLKPFMGIVAIYFAMRGDWRTVKWSVGLGAAVFFSSFIPTWPNILDAFASWRDATHHFTTPPFITKPDNQSAYGMFLRMFTPTTYSTPWVNLPGLVPVFMTLSITLAATLAVIGLRMGGDRYVRIGPKPAVLLLEFSMMFALAAFCGPLTEGNHVIMGFAGLAGASIIGVERIQAHSRNSRLWILTMIAWALPCLFVIFPKSVWFTFGTSASWHDIDGWKVVLSGRAGLLLLGAGAFTAVTLWRERVALAAQTLARDARFQHVANQNTPIRIYRIEDEKLRQRRGK